MSGQRPAGDAPEGPPPASRSYKVFVIGIFGLLGLGFVGYSTALWLLGSVGMLPPPPLTANACIDEKFKFLADHDLREVDLISVGSSITWRNLDVGIFQRTGIAARPINAAPCYLHLSETTYYTEFLLHHMNQVRTVVTVLAPRDFEKCASPKEEFFSAELAGAYVFYKLPPLPLYLANLKPKKFLTDALRIKKMRTDPEHRFSIFMDAYGNGPLHRGNPWMPKPVLTDTCFDALSELEHVVNARNAKLVVATVPLHPDWLAMHDPDGHVVRSLESRIRASLRNPSTLFLPGSQSRPEAARHADAVHFFWESAVDYTRLLAARMAGTRKPAAKPEATGDLAPARPQRSSLDQPAPGP